MTTEVNVEKEKLYTCLNRHGISCPSLSPPGNQFVFTKVYDVSLYTFLGSGLKYYVHLNGVDESVFENSISSIRKKYKSIGSIFYDSRRIVFFDEKESMMIKFKYGEFLEI